MFWFARYEKRQIVDRKDAIREALIRLCSEDAIFIDAITLGTGDVSRVRSRFDIWGNALKDIVERSAHERRLFTYAEKQQLFDDDQTCQICNQRIESVDDAAVDHKTAFSKGGNTDMDNAQLTHRYCNRVKSDT